MKILYVVSKSVEINTSASIRNSAIIEGLIELGHDVTLVSAMPDRKSEYYDVSLLPKGINVQYLNNGKSQKIIEWLKRNRLLRPIKNIYARRIGTVDIYDSSKWMVNHLKEVDFDSCDCIISSSDPKSSHLFVYESLNGNKHKKWVQIWGDPFMGDITRIDKNLEMVKREERKLLGLADVIYYVSKLTLDIQKFNYPESAGKMRYIPIPFLKERILEPHNLKKVSTIELCYCGDYSSVSRDIMPLYNAINAMPNTHLVICGGSDIKLKETKNITVMSRKGYSEVQKIEKNADILIHLSNSSGTQIPGKIYQYSGTNKPILFILDGEIDKIRAQFEKYGRYIFTVNKSDDIEKGIKDVIKENKNWLPVEEFRSRNIVERIELS